MTAFKLEGALPGPAARTNTFTQPLQYNRRQANYKKLPPFSKSARSYRRTVPIDRENQIQVPSSEINVVCGPVGSICGDIDPWEFCRNGPLKPAILLPIGHDPEDYRWPVSGLDVSVHPGHISFDTYDRLAMALMVSGAVCVRPRLRPGEWGNSDLPCYVLPEAVA